MASHTLPPLHGTFIKQIQGKVACVDFPLLTSNSLTVGNIITSSVSGSASVPRVERAMQVYWHHISSAWSMWKHGVNVVYHSEPEKSQRATGTDRCDRCRWSWSWSRGTVHRRPSGRGPGCGSNSPCTPRSWVPGCCPHSSDTLLGDRAQQRQRVLTGPACFNMVFIDLRPVNADHSAHTLLENLCFQKLLVESFSQFLSACAFQTRDLKLRWANCCTKKQHWQPAPTWQLIYIQLHCPNRNYRNI